MDRRQFVSTGLAAAGSTLGLGVASGNRALAETVTAPKPVSFPDGFLWGAATAAYQVEGSWNVDQKGESIWDRFTHTPGTIRNGDTGDVACDSYRRYADDIDLMKRLNLKTFRYSIAWPRIQPTGRGAPNQAGLDFYRRLTDAVLEAGIRPLVTLYHWDLPQALEQEGGWPNRDTADRFADYVEIVGRALGDRIDHWCLLNEPKTFTHVGYWYGAHAPGRKDPLACLRATHTANLAQGKGFRAMKAVRPNAQVGTAVDVAPMVPATDTAADRAAAERWHKFLNLWFVLPALEGRYPDGVLPPEQQAELLGFRPGDETIMRADLDFVGLNYYTLYTVHDAPEGNGMPGLNLRADWATGTDHKTDGGWAIDPPGFYDILATMRGVTGHRPIEITENGAAYNAEPGPDGHIDDPQRVAFLRAHLQELARAIGDGVPVRAYHCWSLMDNFEWAEGYSQRFGLVYVDFVNGQRRVVKASGDWFAIVAASNRVV
ncbi:beta-glucosidase [Lichenihabitans sp. PAMC28606]|uniref:GH1 family beta-glucosidase n=1 Tax=Lichenihabitans sp. PAMC28606 TaxID=2880932 RepID=UPI001D0AF71E|nr:GH1 family beta-glucosidase [Lichenihabitans sp. PAMC28606]UDL94518.1 beta-glucosidase [Lichenihabitans sp. PAMC28606]